MTPRVCVRVTLSFDSALPGQSDLPRVSVRLRLTVGVWLVPDILSRFHRPRRFQEASCGLASFVQVLAVRVWLDYPPI